MVAVVALVTVALPMVGAPATTAGVVIEADEPEGNELPTLLIAITVNV